MIKKLGQGVESFVIDLGKNVGVFSNNEGKQRWLLHLFPDAYHSCWDDVWFISIPKLYTVSLEDAALYYELIGLYPQFQKEVQADDMARSGATRKEVTDFLMETPIGFFTIGRDVVQRDFGFDIQCDFTYIAAQLNNVLQDKQGNIYPIDIFCFGGY